MTERGRSISSLGQAFLSLSGGYNRPAEGAAPRGRGIEAMGQAFQGAGGAWEEPPAGEEERQFRKWWYELPDWARKRLGFMAWEQIQDALEYGRSMQRVTGEGVEVDYGGEVDQQGNQASW